MSDWKVLVVLLFGCASLALMIATIISTMGLGDGTAGWPLAAGLAAATLAVGALFIACLRGMDRSYGR